MKIKVEPNGALGIIFTFLSIAILLSLGVGMIGVMIYGAFVTQSALMMGCVLLCLLAGPIAWLKYAGHMK